MIRRICLLLFLIALAVPATVAPWQANAASHPHRAAVTDCHGAPAAPAPSNDDRPSPGLNGLHGCIGCIVITGHAAVLPEGLQLGRIHHPLPVARMIGVGASPNLPPPRG